MLLHAGATALHADPAYLARDVGRYPYYKNGRTILSNDFRYFGKHAFPIPETLWSLQRTAETLGQGHRVYAENDPEIVELDALFTELWRCSTKFTANVVESEAYDHKPRKRAFAGRLSYET